MKTLNFKKNIGKGIFIFVFSLLILLTVLKPEICKIGAVSGILLCGRVIIPSIFPFTVCILFIMKLTESNLSGELTFKERILIVLFSLIGGYPIGAKLLDNAVKQKKISEKSARRMLNFCVNAGPAFIIGAVGNGIIGSKILGFILFISHISSSLILALFLREKKIKQPFKTQKNTARQSISDSFVSSVAESSSATLSICSFIILFSVIASYTDYFSQSIPLIKYISPFLEVTNAVSKTGNIYFISFLLGFSGICIWCQILSLGKSIKIRLLKFSIFRIIHGLLSSFITWLLIKIFRITVPCFSNSVGFSSKLYYSTPALSISLFILTVIFIITLMTKKRTGNLLEDMV